MHPVNVPQCQRSHHKVQGTSDHHLTLLDWHREQPREGLQAAPSVVASVSVGWPGLGLHVVVATAALAVSLLQAVVPLLLTQQ